MKAHTKSMILHRSCHTKLNTPRVNICFAPADCVIESFSVGVQNDKKKKHVINTDKSTPLPHGTDAVGHEEIRAISTFHLSATEM